MSESKSSKQSKAKAAPAPKGKSDSAGTKPKSEAKPKAKDDAAGASTKPSDSKAPDGGKDSSTDAGKDSGTESGTDAGKSARESIGGKSDAHYGYFSSVRTPAYRSGWDAIWGGGNGEDGSGGGDGAGGNEARRRQSAPRGARVARVRKRRDPVTVTLDLDALPPRLKDGLVEIARAELRKSRVSYERRAKAGAVDWRIVCRVD